MLEIRHARNHGRGADELEEPCTVPADPSRRPAVDRAKLVIIDRALATVQCRPMVIFLSSLFGRIRSIDYLLATIPGFMRDSYGLMFARGGESDY